MKLRLSSQKLIKIIGVYSLLVLLVLMPIIILSPNVDLNAKVTSKMMFSAIVLWVGVCGLWLKRNHEQLCVRLRNKTFNETLKFVLTATALACVEEACTCLMTNLAGVFGGTRGVQGITNTTNYFHLIFLHSVITFIPAFFVWAWLLQRYAFSAAQAFLLYGFTGTVGEAIFARPDSLFAGYWIFVYGLFVYLPASAMRRPENLRQPKLQHYVLAIFLPILVTIPVAFAAIAVDFSLGLPHVAATNPPPK